MDAKSRSVPSALSDLASKARKAPWLLSPYDAEVWIVSDTLNVSRTEVINFAYRMPDGKDLGAHHDFYASVKEYAFWVRDVRVSRTDTAKMHAQFVRAIMHLAHRLFLDGLTSFSQVQPLDVEGITNDSRFGLDCILRASSRLKERFQLVCEGHYGPDPFAALRAPWKGSRVARELVLEWCGLPAKIQTAGSVSDVLDEHSEEFRITRRYGKKSARDRDRALTSQAIRRYLVPLEHLFGMRRFTHAATLSFDPFPEGAHRVAEVIGLSTMRTAIAPPKLMLDLLEQATRVVNEVKGESEDPEANLDAAIASWILVAAFTARRKEELATLQVGCSAGSRQSGWWLRVHIGKTLMREDIIPIPELVHRAIELMTVLSASARKAGESDLLFQTIGSKGKPRLLPIGKLLDRFAERHNVRRSERNTSEDRTGWHWHPHQFRRFFAVLYFYRFDGASIEALSHHLRHFNLDMTRHYISHDPEAAAIWTDVQWGYMGDVARSIVAGQRSVAGGMGDRLKKAQRRLLDVLRRSVLVASPDRISASLKLLMRREGLILTPKPWVLCSCPNTTHSSSKASCRRASGATEGVSGPDFAFAGATVCGTCPYAIIEQRTLDVLSKEFEDLLTRTSAGAAKDRFNDWQAARLVEVYSLSGKIRNTLAT